MNCRKSTGQCSRSSFTILVAMLASALLVPAQGLAQKTEPKTDQERQEAFMKLGQKMEQVVEELQKIQTKVIETDKKLKKEQDKLFDMVTKNMKKRGVDPDKEMAQANKLREKVADESLSEEKRREIAMELMAKAQKLQQAQMEAFKEPKIEKAREAFQKKMEAAMIKAEPKAKSLIKEFESLKKRMEAIRSAG